MEKVTPGTVAVIVHEDGTEKIVSTSMVTEDGIVLTVSGTQTVKVIDNAKSFMDVPKSNVSYNEIASLSAREIMVGKTDDKFDLHNSVTLNQIANVAGRIVGAVDVKDYNAGIVWGAENGLKTGNVAAAPLAKVSISFSSSWVYGLRPHISTWCTMPPKKVSPAPVVSMVFTEKLLTSAMTSPA